MLVNGRLKIRKRSRNNKHNGQRSRLSNNRNNPDGNSLNKLHNSHRSRRWDNLIGNNRRVRQQRQHNPDGKRQGLLLHQLNQDGKLLRLQHQLSQDGKLLRRRHLLAVESISQSGRPQQAPVVVAG